MARRRPRGRLLDGGIGDDTLIAACGDDTLIGTEGSDLLQGGAGNDQADPGQAGGSVAALDTALPTTLEGGDGDDTLVGGTRRHDDRRHRCRLNSRC